MQMLTVPSWPYITLAAGFFLRDFTLFVVRDHIDEEVKQGIARIHSCGEH